MRIPRNFLKKLVQIYLCPFYFDSFTDFVGFIIYFYIWSLVSLFMVIFSFNIHHLFLFSQNLPSRCNNPHQTARQHCLLLVLPSWGWSNGYWRHHHISDGHWRSFLACLFTSVSPLSRVLGAILYRRMSLACHLFQRGLLPSNLPKFWFKASHGYVQKRSPSLDYSKFRIIAFHKRGSLC